MALQIKTGQTKQDAMGNIYPAAYLVIDQIHIDKKAREVQLHTTIYGSQKARRDGFSDIGSLSKVYMITGEAFDALFSVDALIENVNQWSQGYEYLSSIKDEDGTLIFGNWEAV